MNIESLIPEPFQFNALKHHLDYIRQFINDRLSDVNKRDTMNIVMELKHIGTSVMDVYSGSLSVTEILEQTSAFLKIMSLENRNVYSQWTGRNHDDFKTITLSDTSIWMFKYHDASYRYVHLFPARMSPFSFRVKANTLKTAILYYLIEGKDFISSKDLNKARKFLGLSPVKSPSEAESITKMIELLRI